MGPLKPREDRRPVTVPARLRSEAGWCDVTIGNVSSRGLMLRCVAPPPRRAYIEVRHQGVCIVGQVVWTSGARCGVRTQDRVDVESLLSQGRPQTRRQGNDRRAASRPVGPLRRPSLSAQADASRRFARLLDFTVVAVGVVVGAALAATLVFEAMSAPFGRVAEALPGAGSHTN